MVEVQRAEPRVGLLTHRRDGGVDQRGGRKAKDRQGEVKLGKTPCSIPLQGSFFTPEASVRKR